MLDIWSNSLRESTEARGSSSSSCTGLWLHPSEVSLQTGYIKNPRNLVSQCTQVLCSCTIVQYVGTIKNTQNSIEQMFYLLMYLNNTIWYKTNFPCPIASFTQPFRTFVLHSSWPKVEKLHIVIEFPFLLDSLCTICMWKQPQNWGKPYKIVKNSLFILCTF